MYVRNDMLNWKTTALFCNTCSENCLFTWEKKSRSITPKKKKYIMRNKCLNVKSKKVKFLIKYRIVSLWQDRKEFETDAKVET